VNGAKRQMELLEEAAKHFDGPLNVEASSGSYHPILVSFRVSLAEYIKQKFWIDHDMKDCYVEINGNVVRFILTSPIYPASDLSCNGCGKPVRTRCDGYCKACHAKEVAWRD
jgi:hypothetical protein